MIPVANVQRYHGHHAALVLFNRNSVDKRGAGSVGICAYIGNIVIIANIDEQFAILQIPVNDLGLGPVNSNRDLPNRILIIFGVEFAE